MLYRVLDIQDVLTLQRHATQQLRQQALLNHWFDEPTVEQIVAYIAAIKSDQVSIAQQTWDHFQITLLVHDTRHIAVQFPLVVASDVMYTG